MQTSNIWLLLFGLAAFAMSLLPSRLAPLFARFFTRVDGTYRRLSSPPERSAGRLPDSRPSLGTL
jgi:hypothetical protein